MLIGALFQLCRRKLVDRGPQDVPAVRLLRDLSKQTGFQKEDSAQDPGAESGMLSKHESLKGQVDAPGKVVIGCSSLISFHE